MPSTMADPAPPCRRPPGGTRRSTSDGGRGRLVIPRDDDSGTTPPWPGAARVGNVPVPPALLWRPGLARQRIFDAALAAAVVLLCWYSAAESPATGPREPAWLTAAASLALGMPLAVRRRRPLSAAAVVLATAALCL